MKKTNKHKISIKNIFLLLCLFSFVWYGSSYTTKKVLEKHEMKKLKTDIKIKEDSIIRLLNVYSINSIQDLDKEIDRTIKQRSNYINDPKDGIFLINSIDKNLYSFIYYWELFDKSPIFRPEDRSVQDFVESSTSIIKKMDRFNSSINDLSLDLILGVLEKTLSSSSNNIIQAEVFEKESQILIESYEEYCKYNDNAIVPCSNQLLFNLELSVNDLIRLYVSPKSEFERMFKPLEEMKNDPELYRIIDNLLTLYLKYKKTHM